VVEILRPGFETRTQEINLSFINQNENSRCEVACLQKPWSAGEKHVKDLLQRMALQEKAIK